MSHVLWNEASLESRAAEYSIESSSEAEIPELEENNANKAQEDENNSKLKIIRHFPVFTISMLVATCNYPSPYSDLIALILSIGLLYLLCIHIYSPGGLRKMDIQDQVSPDFPSWWMYTIVRNK